MRTVAIVTGLIGATMIAGSVNADPAAEAQATQLVTNALSSEQPRVSQVKSTDAGVVCGIVTYLQAQDNTEIDRKFLVDTKGGSPPWIEGRTGADARAVQAADKENAPKWRACHR